MGTKTLEGRIESTKISTAFNRVLKVIPTKSTIYFIVQEETGIHPNHTRKIVEQTNRNGPEKLYQCLSHLIEELGGETSINSASKLLADEIMQNKDFINKNAFMDYLLPIINSTIINVGFPLNEVHKYELRDFLYNKHYKNISPWHYITYKILRKIKDGEINVDERYLKKTFGTYNRLLHFAYQSLTEREGMQSGFCLEIIGQRLNLSPQTVKSHLFKKMINGYNCNFIRHYDNLINFIIDELFTKIDFRDKNKTLNSKLEGFKKTIRDGNYKDNLLIMMNPNYSGKNTVNILKVIMELKYEIDFAGKSEFKPLFVFNSAKIGNALHQYL